MSNQVSLSQTSPSDPELGSDCDAGFRPALLRSSWISVTVIATLSLLIVVQAAGLYFTDVSLGFLVGVAAVVWLGMVAATVVGEFPKGDEFLMARLGLATFCRTAPAMVVVLFALTYPTRLVSAAVAIGVLYLVGLFVSVLLDVRRFRLVEKQ